MNLVRAAIDHPVTTAVGVLLLCLFGGLSLMTIPVQLTPTVVQPQVTVTTFWPGASPLEVEREIVEEQEEQLKGLEGVLEMESSAQDSQGTITLTFPTGTNIDTALVRVANRLEQVPSYPADADKPILTNVDANANAAAWFVIIPGGANPFAGDVETLNDFVDDNVKAAIERVPGVAQSNFFGGVETEMKVIVDPEALAARGIGWLELMRALDRDNGNVSGGDFAEGKRRWIVRTLGELRSTEDIESVVVAIRGGVPIRVSDVAEVHLGHKKPTARVYHQGEPTIALNVVRAPGANLLEVMDEVRETVADLNQGLLARHGLVMNLAYDSTDYIVSSIGLVRQSLILGGGLAIIVLLLFLRSRSSTLIVAIAMPVSLIGTFLVMAALGRTVNVISLAGMAFAVGMVVDNSIVVLENIYRHCQLGKDRATAAYDGAREVWGAVLASTLTTIAVFVPVVFVEEEAGQLFRDIAIAISCAVALSLLVAMTVIPTLSARILEVASTDDEGGFANLWGLAAIPARWSDRLVGLVRAAAASNLRRVLIVLVFTVAAVGGSVLLTPKAEYLPLGNQNFLFGIIAPPPGYNIDEVSSLQSLYVEQMEHMWLEPGPEKPGGGLDNFFYVALNNVVFMGAKAVDPLRVREVIPEFQKVNAQVPGAIAFMNQMSLFASGFGEGRNVDVEIIGPDLEQLIALGGQTFRKVQEVLPGAQSRPIPGLDLLNPEIHVEVDRRRCADVGLSATELGVIVSALVDGARASQFQHEGREIDLRVQAALGELHSTHLLEQLSIATPSGQTVPLGQLATVRVGNGPVQIDHKERQRAVTIQITPAEDMPLQTAMEIIQSQVVEPMVAGGQLGSLYRIRMSGSADKLTQTADALKWNFLLAVIITYLLMAALFESFLYPFVILFSVPLAALGGFCGLALVNTVANQPLDVLTMLGFIILVGTVVNNAILLVHQTLQHLRRDQMSISDSILDATSTRIRPIFMSVATSVCGMLPLVLFPGAGSELYRGLGSVVVGGLIVSTLFTLILVPALLGLVLEAREGLAQRWRSSRGRA